MSLLDKLFGRSKPLCNETDVALPTPEDIRTTNELQLCEKCQFKGKCTFENGCSSLKNLREARVRELNRLRGIKTDDSSRDRLKNELIGLGWRTISRRWKKTYRIFEIQDGGAAVRSLSRSEKDRREYTDEYVVDIPFVTLLDGREAVDMQALKNAILNQEHMWTPH